MAKRAKQSKERDPGSTGPQSESLLAIILIALSTFAIYGQTLSFDFTNWDDNVLLLENEAVRSLAPKNIGAIFTPVPGRTYQPIRVFSYAINWALHKDHPMGYHLVNFLLHGLGAVFLFLLLRDGLVRLRPATKHPVTIAAIVALLFVVHPVNVESVAWVSSRKYGLLAVFYFAAWWCYVRGTASAPSLDWRWLIVASVCCLCAVLSSPFGVTLPAMIVVYDYCCRRHFNPLPVILERKWIYLPLFFCAVGVVPLLMGLTSSGKSVRSGAIKENRAHTFLTMHRCAFDYGRNLAVPLWLNNRYPDRFSKRPSTKTLAVWLAMLALAGLLAVTWRQRHVAPLFCTGWFLIGWLPVSNIIPISTLMADRYMYVPAIGVFLGIVLASSNLLASKRQLAFTWGPAIVILALLAYQRTGVWRNSITLWEDSIAKDDGNYLAYNSLGNAWADERESDKALEFYLKSLDINEDYHLVHYNLARLHDDLGEWSKSIARYERFLAELEKRDDQTSRRDARLNLGVAYGHAGQFSKAYHMLEAALAEEEDFEAINNIANVYNLDGKDEQAEEAYLRALRLKPDSAETRYNYASLLAKLDRSQEAIAQYQQSLAIKADYADAHNNLANLYKDLGQLLDAIAHYKQALANYPKSAAIHNNIAVAYRKNGQQELAAKHSELAIQFNANNPTILFRRGNDLIKANQVDEAIAAYQEALKLNQYHAASHAQLGHIYRARKQRDLAIRHYQTALQHGSSLGQVPVFLAELYGDSQTDRVIALYEQYLAGKPDDTRVRINLGATYVKAKQLDKAIATYQRVLEDQPDSYAAHVNLGVAFQQAGEAEKALPHYHKALIAQPKNAQLHAAVFTLQLKLGKTPEALETTEALLLLDGNHISRFVQACAHHPSLIQVAHQAWRASEDANQRYAIGLAMNQKNMLPQAIEHLKVAIALNPDSPQMLQALGGAYFRARRHAEALAAFQQALELAPDSAELQNNVGSAYFTIGNKQKAIEHYQKALVIDPNNQAAAQNLQRVQAAP